MTWKSKVALAKTDLQTDREAKLLEVKVVENEQ